MGPDISDNTWMSRNLLIVALIAVVNSIGYGIIIPILYSYSHKFGLSDFQNGLLFALFSLCAFISNPIIGRLSDKYGRKPMLVLSLAGTSLSFFMAAFAPSALFLFLSRALDGITAGNIPVISAVISDTTDAKSRAKGFGILGAAFGFGFFFGPAISAFTVGINPALPFIIAGIIAAISVVVTMIFLPETNQHMGEVRKGKLFDIPLLAKTLVHPAVGKTLQISLLYNTAFGILIFAYQPFLVKIIGVGAKEISIIFTMIGVIGIVTQMLLIQRTVKKFGDLKPFTVALFFITLSFVAYFFSKTLTSYLVIVALFATANSFVGPLIQTIISKQTDMKSQGSIQGLNASYVSIGNIIGPLIGGLVAQKISIPSPFLLAAIFTGICWIMSLSEKEKDITLEDAFTH